MMFTLVIVLVTVTITVIGATSSSHTKYVVAFLGQDIQQPDEEPSTTKYTVVLTNPGSGSVLVSVTSVNGLSNTTVPIGSGESKIERFEQRHSMNGSEVANKSIIFTAVSSFTLHVFIETMDHVEGLLGIPLQNLGTDYHVSTFCPLGGYCQIIVAAAEPESTYVHLRIPKHVHEIVFCIGKKFFRSQRDTQLTLAPFEAVQVESASDLTGTFIYSSLRVAVFVGTRNMTMEGKVTHLAEQLQPGTQWGKEFFLETLGANGYGDVIQITAREANTEVTMKGYPSFVMTNYSETVHRRLDQGMTTHITANHSIQVIQITGLTYATTGETANPGMVVVPAVSHFSLSELVSCGTKPSVAAEFHVVMAKLDKLNVTVASQAFTNDSISDVHFTDFTIGTVSVAALDNYLINTTGQSSFGGVATCATGGAMALGFGFNRIPSNKVTLPVTQKTCIEGLWATTTYELGTSKAMVPHRVALANTTDVIKLRVKTCGTAVVQLYKDDGTTNDHVMLQFYKNGISPHIKMVTCTGGKCTSNGKITDSFNKDIAGCNTDMAFYWIRQTDTQLCCGAGPLPSNSCEGNTVVNMTTSWKVKVVQMFGLMATATFSYDIDSGSCDIYEADWRCQDLSEECHKYKPDMCTSDTYCTWATKYCRKFCGKCSPDNFGRKFTVLVPLLYPDTSCSILLTPTDGVLGNVAVGAVVPMENEGVLSAKLAANGTWYYNYITDQPDKKHNVVIILSQNDIDITVLVKKSDKIIFAYPVYPADALGLETMSLSNCASQQSCTCSLVAVDYATTVTTYFDTTNNNTNWVIDDGKSYDVQPGKAMQFSTTGGKFYHKAVLFRSDRPFYVYCGVTNVQSNTILCHFHHILPTYTYGTRFVTPSFELVPANRPFDATLFIQAGKDNTIVTVDGDFQSILPIFHRGDFTEQLIDAATVYTVTSNYPITLGLTLIDSAHDKNGGFYILPPSRNFPASTKLFSWVSKFVYDKFSYVNETTYYVNDTGKSSTTDSYAMTLVLGSNSEWFVIPGQTKNAKEKSTEPCRISTSSVGDSIDNDCDGLTDEDTCFSGYDVYRQDNDLDGGFGEDCCCQFSEAVVVLPPTDPDCIPIDIPDDHCWTICTQCPCSWVEELERRDQLSNDQRQAEADADIIKYQDALQVDTETLQAETSKMESAGDKRQSAANIGYLGIAMFAVIFGGLILMDVTALLRDVYILKDNLAEGFQRLSTFVRRR